MSIYHFFKNKNITRAYNDPYSILLGDIASIRKKLTVVIDSLSKDVNLINPEVILPFLSGKNTDLDTLFNDVQKGRKLGTDISAYKTQYEQLINDLTSGLDEAKFGNEDKLGRRCLEGFNAYAKWHDKLSEALLEQPGRMHRIIR